MFYPSYEDYMRDIFYYNSLQNQNFKYPYGAGFNNQNLNDYFPSIYKIVNPVIQKVVSGNNYQYTNEESVNNIVDVVLGIVSYDINNLENLGNSGVDKKQAQSQVNSGNSQENKETNTLLKDLIKILTIKELQTKQNVRRFPYSYGSEFAHYMPALPYMAN